MRPPLPCMGIVVLIALSGCEPSGAGLPDEFATAEARARGRELFLRHCAICHGANADGRGQRRSALSGPPADFTDPSWASRTPPRQAFETIRDGKPGTSMPAWKILSESDTWQLVAYLRAVPAGEAGAPP